MPTETPVIVNQEYLEDIADAIRAKNGSLDTYTPAEMAQAISNLSSGSSSVINDYESRWTSDKKTLTSPGDTQIVTEAAGSSARIKGLSRLDATGAQLATTLKENAFAFTVYDSSY